MSDQTITIAFESDELEALRKAILELDRVWDFDEARALRDGLGGSEYQRLSPAHRLKRVLHRAGIDDEPALQKECRRMMEDMREKAGSSEPVAADEADREGVGRVTELEKVTDQRDRLGRALEELLRQDAMKHHVPWDPDRWAVAAALASQEFDSVFGELAESVEITDEREREAAVSATRERGMVFPF